ncbi:acetolactate decarboxylase [Isosphaeraceae bacterium EP7]
MIRHLLKPFLCLATLALTTCAPDRSAAPPAPHTITQVSVINALMVGRYDGLMPIPELLRHGDFGVGTLDHLDGELTILDGKAYQVRGDGKVAAVPPDRSTPFAVITPFSEDGNFPCQQVPTLEALDAHLDDALPQKNNFVAIRIDGRFDSITLRSVHRQEPPYKPLAEVAKSQSMWTHTTKTGTMIGIRSPAWVAGLNVPGYHWHFLTDDRTIGGHVLDCKFAQARVKFAVCPDWLLKLDPSPAFNAEDLGQDLRREVKRVESSRGGERD